ncbi:MAG TPA: MBOAT family protein, partial [Planctomycetia bacterium]|nr:MBOAT family protein [Planctomycetia bacterium]
PLFRSPWRATSVAEFWGQRWNIAASAMFYKHSFAPLSRYGKAPALLAAFGLSAAGHWFLVAMALGDRKFAASCAIFFLIQPFFILVERKVGVRRWRGAGGRAWTFTAMGLASPLIVEPMLQIIERHHSGPIGPLTGAAGALGFLSALSAVNALAAASIATAADRSTSAGPA